MIDVINLQRKVKLETAVYKEYVKELASSVEEADGKTFSVAFVSDDRMWKLNWSFRGKDSTTDVLSFPHEADEFEQGSPPYEGGVASASGDGVVLSVAPASVESPTEDHLPAKAVPLLRKEGSFRRLDTAAEWETHGGGVVRSVGVGAGIAGFGAGLIVIDDPVKNRAEAESVTYRDRVWEWFNDDIYTRMEPNAAIILIQTRWHEDDLAGRLLKEMEDGGEQWDVVSLPALAESENTNYELQITNGNKKTNRENEDLNSKFVIRNSKLTDPLGRKPGHAL